MSKLTLSVSELINRFQAEIDQAAAFQPGLEFNAFAHPDMPVITNQDPRRIQFFEWGLIPSWARDKSIQNSTLNARVETICDKPSFRSVLSRRCLIPADGFYEWQWLDSKGKEKQKFLITTEEEQVFAYAGLWNSWLEPGKGEMLNTFTIITRPANELMSRIHNTKKRMPWILPATDESHWLMGEDVPLKPIRLKAVPVNPRPSNPVFFV